MKISIKIDKFLYILVSVLVVLALLMVVVFRGIFSAILIAYGPPQTTAKQDVRVNKENLSKALEAIRQKQAVRLDFN